MTSAQTPGRSGAIPGPVAAAAGREKIRAMMWSIGPTPIAQSAIKGVTGNQKLPREILEPKRLGTRLACAPRQILRKYMFLLYNFVD